MLLSCRLLGIRCVLSPSPLVSPRSSWPLTSGTSITATGDGGGPAVRSEPFLLRRNRTVDVSPCSEESLLSPSSWISSSSVPSCDRPTKRWNWRGFTKKKKKNVCCQIPFVAFGLVATLGRVFFLFHSTFHVCLFKHTSSLISRQAPTHLVNVHRLRLKNVRRGELFAVCDNKLSPPRMLCSLVGARSLTLCTFLLLIRCLLQQADSFFFFFLSQDLQTNTGLNSSQCSVQWEKKKIIRPFPP